jgi:hypothetical protein
VSEYGTCAGCSYSVHALRMRVVRVLRVRVLRACVACRACIACACIACACVARVWHSKLINAVDDFGVGGIEVSEDSIEERREDGIEESGAEFFWTILYK